MGAAFSAWPLAVWRDEWPESIFITHGAGISNFFSDGSSSERYHLRRCMVFIFSTEIRVVCCLGDIFITEQI